MLAKHHGESISTRSPRSEFIKDAGRPDAQPFQFSGMGSRAWVSEVCRTWPAVDGSHSSLMFNDN